MAPIPYFISAIMLLLVSKITEGNDVNSNSTDVIETCYSRACYASALVIQKSLNESLDPCENFYSFVCDGWIKSETKPFATGVMNSLALEILTEIIDIFGTVDKRTLPKASVIAIEAYNTCLQFDKMDSAALDWFDNLWEMIGGFPLISRDWSENEYNWLNSNAVILRKFFLSPLLSVGISVDNRNSSRNIILIGQPSKEQRIDIEAYALLPTILASANNYEVPSYNIYMDILQLNRIQQHLNSVTRYPESVDDIVEHEKIMKLKDLQIAVPDVDWLSLLHDVFGNQLNSASETFTLEKEVMVREINYVINVVNMMTNHTVNNRTIANYLGTTLLVKILENFPQATSHLIKSNPIRYRREVSKNLEDMKEEKKQELVCLSSILGSLSFAVDHIYLMNSQYHKYKLQPMIQRLKMALKQMMKREKWIDKETKQYLVQKAKAMGIVTDFPKWILDPMKLDAYFQNFPKMTESALENYSRMKQFELQTWTSFLFVQNNRLKWPIFLGLPSSSLNAYYVRPFNTVVLPFVLQRFPLFHPERPEYLNYGAAGMVIGHEMGHGFDNMCVQRDQFGALVKWKSEKFQKDFQARTNCLINKYNNYTYGPDENKLDGKKTLSQNIADLLGLRLAYRAFKRLVKSNHTLNPLPVLSNYTPEQMFFISFGTTWCDAKPTGPLEESDHAPPKFRVLGTVSNMNEFAKAFKCKKGSPMNPRNKCFLW